MIYYLDVQAQAQARVQQLDFIRQKKINESFFEKKFECETWHFIPKSTILFDSTRRLEFVDFI